MSLTSYLHKKIKSKKFWKRFILFVFITPVLLFTLLVGIVYWKQDAIVQKMLTSMNAGFKGRIEITGSHISPFANFPYISIDLEGMKIYENKKKDAKPILNVKDAYLGFDLWTIVNGTMQIKKLSLHNGRMDLIQYKNGTLNISEAFSSTKKTEDPSKEFHLDLKQIELKNIDFNKINQATGIIAEAVIAHAKSSFRTSPQHVYASLESKFMLNIISNGDTTFIKHKHFKVKTELDYFTEKQTLTIKPSIAELEGSEFNMLGKIDFMNDAFVDFKFNGNKSDFKLFMAMAPEELTPLLNMYENKGKIYFDARVSGKTANGNMPYIKANFGCKEGYFKNTSVNKKLDELNFKGFFTNGKNRNMSTMEFQMENFTARPEAGTFSGHLHVKNFESPEIDLKLKSKFKLDFLAKFFDINGLRDLDGNITLTMNFRDIIDLNRPERSIEKLNESYFTQLKVENLAFKTNAYGLPIKDVDLYAEVRGHEARIEYFKIKVGKSDFSMNALVSDLPAILHHTNTPVKTDLAIKCKLLDLYELTGGDSVKSINEQVQKLSMDLSFISSAKALAESKNIPVGEFYIKNMYARLKHYPHILHDFHSDVIIDENNLTIKDFNGAIDKSDFLISGTVKSYPLWFDKNPVGDTKIEFNINSKLFQLADVFSYKGANYVPEDYRHEEFSQLKIHGYTALHFKQNLLSVDAYFDQLNGKMKIHPLTFEKFKGRVHYENEHLIVENFSGKMGRTDFKTTLHYYLGQDEDVRKRDNYFELQANRLDMDELFNYNPPPKTSTGTTLTVNHDAGFNIYELPFTNMTFKIDIAHMNYHRYLLNNVKSNFRTTKNHYIYFDDLHIDAAGGSFNITGYFNGSDPHKVYFSPKMQLKNVDLDKLLFKFENFGQDHLVSENLHGKLNASINGNIRMHTDLVPSLDDSEIHMDVEVLNGRLENYKMLDYVADYFADKNLKKVQFDTLKNHVDLTKGILTIPNMTINSSLGYMQISGTQDMNLNMTYYLKIPWKLVTQAGSSKLFGKKTEEVNPDQVDAIQYLDKNKTVRFINIKLTGTAETFKIALGKKKDKDS